MNDRLTNLLAGALTPGIYRLASRAGAPAIAGAAGREGWRFFHLAGRDIASKADFLAACAQAMAFPAYSGQNWDALVDCLRDLSWAPAPRGWVLLYDDAGRFAAARPDEFAVAVDILRSSVESWHATPTPMIVLLRGAGRAARGLPAL